MPLKFRQLLLAVVTFATAAATASSAGGGGEPDPTSFSLRRDVRESDGTTARMYTDGSSLLSIVFGRGGESGRVVDCSYLSEKEASRAVSALFYEALVGQAYGNTTAYFADVKRIYRKCKRQLREVLDNTAAEGHLEAMARKQLKDGFEAEASWCNLYDAGVPTVPRPGADEACCRALRNCSVQIAGFQRRYHLFNYNSGPAFGCDCVSEFAACLQAADTPLARRTLDVYFRSGAVKCLTLSNDLELCDQHDELYASCLKSTRVERASFAPVPHLSNGARSAPATNSASARGEHEQLGPAERSTNDAGSAPATSSAPASQREQLGPAEGSTKNASAGTVHRPQTEL